MPVTQKPSLLATSTSSLAFLSGYYLLYLFFSSPLGQLTFLATLEILLPYLTFPSFSLCFPFPLLLQPSHSVTSLSITFRTLFQRPGSLLLINSSLIGHDLYDSNHKSALRRIHTQSFFSSLLLRLLFLPSFANPPLLTHS